MSLRAQMPDDYRRRATRSDFWRAYGAAFPARTHRFCGKEEGETNHAERWFGTVRFFVRCRAGFGSAAVLACCRSILSNRASISFIVSLSGSPAVRIEIADGLLAAESALRSRQERKRLTWAARHRRQHPQRCRTAKAII